MPNHITTRIFASPAVLDALAGPESAVDFNSIIPFPEELKNITAEVKIFGSQKDVDAYNAERRADFAKWTPEQREFMGISDDQIHALTIMESTRLMREHGALNWYTWNSAKWGTKWNAYDIKRDTESGFIQFDTAWAHPEPVIKALSEKFPEEMLIVQYADEDLGSNYGEYDLLNGKTTSTTMFTEEDGLDFASQIKYGMNHAALEAKWAADEAEWEAEYAEIQKRKQGAIEA